MIAWKDHEEIFWKWMVKYYCKSFNVQEMFVFTNICKSGVMQNKKKNIEYEWQPPHKHFGPVIEN